MKKAELIDKLLHLGYTTEMCSSTDRYKAKELAHTLIDEYLEDNLIIPDVSHRRELLIAYEKKRGETILMGDTDEEVVDEIMEAINCG